jgi:hypothetical protein
MPIFNYFEVLENHGVLLLSAVFVELHLNTSLHLRGIAARAAICHCCVHRTRSHN